MKPVTWPTRVVPPLVVAVLLASLAVPAPLPTLDITAASRTLVVAPHPDDETIGAGGLMQQVQEAGGTLRVVYLTDGDGYPAGVLVQDHRRKPTASDYREYGLLRQDEAKAALRTLGVDPDAATFLGFPDDGLTRMMARYWSDRRRPFRSPYTRLERPPAPDTLLPGMKYRGEDLSQELALIIGAFRPTLIVMPRREDQHPDHCATPYFVADALSDVQRVHPDYHVDVINYIVHYNSWPFEDDERPDLSAPPGLRGGSSGWLTLPLTPSQQQAKQRALHQYKSQMKVMNWFLDGFVKSNEVFSRPAPHRVILPWKQKPCDD